MTDKEQIEYLRQQVADLRRELRDNFAKKLALPPPLEFAHGTPKLPLMAWKKPNYEILYECQNCGLSLRYDYLKSNEDKCLCGAYQNKPVDFVKKVTNPASEPVR